MLPIDASRPESRARLVKAQDPNWTPWSEWMMLPGSAVLPSRVSMAMPKALVTSAAVGEASMDQPTTRREKVSSTTQQ